MKFNSKNPDHQKKAMEYFLKLINSGSWIELKVMRLPRSIDSNRLYWLWLTAIEKETQIDKNELHYQYRAIFLPRDPDEFTHLISRTAWQVIFRHISNFEYFKEIHLVIDLISRSTTEIDDGEFSQYLKQIQKHARVNFGVILLSLKDQNFKEFYQEYGFL